MRLLFSTLALSIALLPLHALAISDSEVTEITERLESLSTDQLVDRKTELENSLEDGELSEEEAARALFELSTEFNELDKVETDTRNFQLLLSSSKEIENFIKDNAQFFEEVGAKAVQGQAYLPGSDEQK